MLGKMGLKNLGEMSMVMTINKNQHDVIEKATDSIFYDIQSDILMNDSKKNTLKVLHAI
jgi:hypothetical protein